MKIFYIYMKLFFSLDIIRILRPSNKYKPNQITVGKMKELFTNMQEAYLQGAYLEKESIDKLVAKKKQQILADSIKKFNDQVKKEKS